MTIHPFAQARRAGLVVLVGLSLGCSASPSAPTPRTPPVPPLAIQTVSPNAGSTGGGTVVRITGSGFQAGAAVTLDGERRIASVNGSLGIQFTTQAHDPGSVDIVITNPDGGTTRMAGGYTYAPPQSFDFNGNWAGFALAHPDVDGRFHPFHSDMELRFTVQGQSLGSLTCGGETFTFSPPVAVRDGEFAFAGPDGSTISGRIVSEAGTVGTINTAACPGTRWSATRQ